MRTNMKRHILYDWGITRPEVNVLENMWRQRVHACVFESRRALLGDLVQHTPLPRELWEDIFAKNDCLPRMVSDVNYIGFNSMGRMYKVEVIQL